jgi:DNA repair protein RadC
MVSQYAIPVYTISLVREAAVTITERPKFNSSADVATLLYELLEDADREHFLVLMLDRKNRLIGVNTVSVGSLSASVVHPRETFKPAILANAAAVIFAHNHPSGDTAPSPEDRTLTARLVASGHLLGIAVLDHIIVGDASYFSFADQGILEAK